MIRLEGITKSFAGKDGPVVAHTLHDPVRWKFHAVGQYCLDGVQPPLHSWI